MRSYPQTWLGGHWKKLRYVEGHSCNDSESLVNYSTLANIYWAKPSSRNVEIKQIGPLSPYFCQRWFQEKCYLDLALKLQIEIQVGGRELSLHQEQNLEMEKNKGQRKKKFSYWGINGQLFNISRPMLMQTGCKHLPVLVSTSPLGSKEFLFDLTHQHYSKKKPNKLFQMTCQSYLTSLYPFL